MKKNQNLFSIGEVAQALDITRRAILYYEELGLIQPDVKDSATEIATIPSTPLSRYGLFVFCKTLVCPCAMSEGILKVLSTCRR